MENTVETMVTEQLQADAVDTAQSLAEVIGEEQPQEQVPVAEEKPKDAGWIKTRIEKGIAKAEERIRAEYEAKYAPLQEAYLNQEADRLVASGKISDKEMALDYLKRGGTVQKPVEQPRDEQGRFTTKQETNQRANALYQQAETIKAITGVNVMAMYNTDPAVKQKILDGEWDFKDVYEASKAVKAPVPVRSSNGVSIGNTSVANMSDAQFEKLEEALRRGARVKI